MSTLENLKAKFKDTYAREMGEILSRREALPHTLRSADLMDEWTSNQDYRSSSLKKVVECGLGKYQKKAENGSYAVFNNPEQALQLIRQALGVEVLQPSKFEEDLPGQNNTTEPDAYDQACMAAAKVLRVNPNKVRIQFV